MSCSPSTIGTGILGCRCSRCSIQHTVVSPLAMRFVSWATISMGTPSPPRQGGYTIGSTPTFTRRQRPFECSTMNPPGRETQMSGVTSPRWRRKAWRDEMTLAPRGAARTIVASNWWKFSHACREPTPTRVGSPGLHNHHDDRARCQRRGVPQERLSKYPVGYSDAKFPTWRPATVVAVEQDRRNARRLGVVRRVVRHAGSLTRTGASRLAESGGARVDLGNAR